MRLHLVGVRGFVCAGWRAMMSSLLLWNISRIAYCVLKVASRPRRLRSSGPPCALRKGFRKEQPALALVLLCTSAKVALRAAVNKKENYKACVLVFVLIFWSPSREVWVLHRLREDCAVSGLPL